MDTSGTYYPANGADVVAEIEIRRSRFIARLVRADDEEAARAVVTAERSAHPQARHHCSAFRVSADGTGVVERSSDDGEPSGTAGAPMLDVLRGAGIERVAAVVTRYFGGIKLGTGGLARAYSDAVTAALPSLRLVSPLQRARARVALPHDVAARLYSEFPAHGVDVLDAEYGAQAVLTLAAADDEALAHAVALLTRGEAMSERLAPLVVEVPNPRP